MLEKPIYSSFALFVITLFGIGAASASKMQWECKTPLPLGENILIHPLVRADFGGYKKGLVAIFSKGAEFNVWYCPERNSQAVFLRDEKNRPGLNYEIRSVFSYKKPGSFKYNVVILFRVGRAIPGMQDVEEYGGEVYSLDKNRGHFLEIDSEKLTGIRDASGARRALGL